MERELSIIDAEGKKKVEEIDQKKLAEVMRITAESELKA